VKEEKLRVWEGEGGARGSLNVAFCYKFTNMTVILPV
jgi:hypothetical protein